MPATSDATAGPTAATAKPGKRTQRDPNHMALRGEVADPSNPPTGCYFHPRCPFAVERCKVELPALRELRPDHFVSCHRAEELSLRGVSESIN